MRLKMLLFPALLLPACAKPTPSEPEPVMREIRKQPPAPTTWVTARAVEPVSSLLAWLDARSNSRVVLPVTIERRDSVGWSRAFVGTDEAPFVIELDDVRMGLSLNGRLESLCLPPRCTVWLEGSWGATAGIPGGGPTLSVTTVSGLVEPDEAHVVRVPEGTE